MIARFVAGFAFVAVQRVQHENIVAPYIAQRPRLMLAVLEVALLVGAEDDVKPAGNAGVTDQAVTAPPVAAGVSV